MESVLMVRARSGGIDWMAYRMAYSSPVWFDWMGPGTLMLVFLGSFSWNQMPLPAAAFDSPLFMQDPSVKIVTGGLVNSIVLVAMGLGCVLLPRCLGLFWLPFLMGRDI